MAALIGEFNFTEKQAKAILEMRLQRLTGLEREKIIKELEAIKTEIARLRDILGDVKKIYEIIVSELTEIKAKFSDVRKTKIEDSDGEVLVEDLISKEDVIVSMTYSGNIKRMSTEEYKVQKRGGKGVKGAGTREEDFVWKIFSANTLSSLLMFSDRGRLFWQKVYRLPQGSRTSKGRSVKNIAQLSSGENVRAVLVVEEYKKENFVVMLTERGIIKKTSLQLFSKPRPSGLIALSIDLDDNLKEAKLSTSSDDVLIVTKEGMSIRFDESGVRGMGRSARGVKGITLGKEDKVIGMTLIPKDCTDCLLIVTKGGYGKRTSLDEYRVQSRGGVGIITQKTTEKVGEVVSARRVSEDEELIITTNEGQAIRMACKEISKFGRNTQGVRLINLKDGEYVTGVAVLKSEDT